MLGKRVGGLLGISDGDAVGVPDVGTRVGELLGSSVGVRLLTELGGSDGDLVGG